MKPCHVRRVVGAFGALVLVACGGAAKPADSPGTAESHSSDDPPSPPASSDSSSGGKSDDHPSSASGGSSTPAPSEPAQAGSKTPYDKDSVEVELKRASRQVKANCGSATDDNGTAPGPWGKTTASVTLGRNGHIKDMTVPAPYDGQPDGLCAVNAFKKIQFPPYASSSDVVIPWDIEFVKPKH